MERLLGALVTLVILAFATIMAFLYQWGLVPALILTAIWIVIVLIAWMLDVPDPAWKKRIFDGLVVFLVLFAIVGAITIGNWMPWPQEETTNDALDAKIAQAKEAREEKAATKKKDDELLVTIHEIAQDVSGVDRKTVEEKLGQMSEKNEANFNALHGKLDAQQDFLKGEISKMKPPDNPAPGPKMPKAEEVPKTLPAPTTEELILPKQQVYAPTEKLALKCTCGIVHEYSLQNGTSTP